MFNFDFLVKGLEIVSPPHFMYDFSRKMFLMLYSIDWPNLISWLSLLLEILINMCIAIVSSPVVTSWTLKVNRSCRSSRFSIWQESQDKNLNILRMKRDFKVKWKAFFIIFKGLTVTKNHIRAESELFNFYDVMELGNCALRFVRVWSLVYLIRVDKSL